MKRVIALLLVFVGACAGKPPEYHEYLLPMPAPGSAAGVGAPIRLLPVTVPPYLDQKGIVLQTEGTEVHIARHNRWAEPLAAGLDRYLQAAITSATGRMVEVSPLTTEAATTVVRVRIRQLHGSSAGTVRLTAEWSVTVPPAPPVLHGFEATTDQHTDGYAALVDAHAALLDRLASAIAGSLDGE